MTTDRVARAVVAGAIEKAKGAPCWCGAANVAAGRFVYVAGVAHGARRCVDGITEKNLAAGSATRGAP